MKESGLKEKKNPNKPTHPKLKLSITKRFWYSIQCAIMAEWN